MCDALPRGIRIVLNVSIWSLSISAGLPDRGASSREKSPARKCANTSDMFPLSQHLLHALRASYFLCFSRVFAFLEIIKHNTLKMFSCFLPSSVLKMA